MIATSRFVAKPEGEKSLTRRSEPNAEDAQPRDDTAKPPNRSRSWNTAGLVHGLRGAVRPAITWYRHRHVRPADIILASYPKSGNTWLKSLLVTLIEGTPPDLDRLERLVPYVGLGDPPEMIAGSRLLKTHEAFSPAYRRGIFVLREGREVAVSYFHATRRWRGQGSLARFEAFLPSLLDGRIDHYTPWQDHSLSWLRAVHASPRWLCLAYSDLRRDPLSTLARVADFLELEAPRERIAEAVAANTKQELRAREAHCARMAMTTDRTGASFFRPDDHSEIERLFTPDLEDLWQQRTGAQLEEITRLFRAARIGSA